MFDAIMRDVRYAMRTLRSTPGFAAVAILSLALGIGANTAIFSLIDSLLLKTLPVSHPEQLLQVTMGKDAYFTNPIWEQLRDRQDVFSGIFAYGMAGGRFNLAAGGEARYAHGNVASGQFFDTLGLHAMIGRTFTLADDRRGCPGTAVLSYGFWQKEYGGRADVVGKTISLDSHSFEILGVLEPGFTGVDVGSNRDLYVPVCAEKIIRGETWELGPFRVIGRPQRGVSPSQAEARLKTLAPQVFEATVPPKLKPEARESYRKRTFDTQMAANGLSFIRKEYRQALIVLMVMVGVVLLIACANVANLLLARGAARQREIAIRMALGSGRGRLVRQLLTESLVLSLTGAVLGILFAQWSTRLLVGFLSSGWNQVYLDLSVDSRVLAFTAGVAILTGLLFGLAPAWRGTQVNAQLAMKANARGVFAAIEHGGFGLGKALVVVQVALSLVLVVGAGLLLATFFRLETLDPGFERQHVLLVDVDLRNGHYPPARNGAVFEEMLEHLRALPGVRSASASAATPIDNSLSVQDLQIEGYTSKSKGDTAVYFNEVSDRFFETLGTDLVAGRDFNAHDTPESPKVAIVNQTLAKKFFAGQDPIGRRYRHGGGNQVGDLVEIIGVVKDAKYVALREQTHPTTYLAASQDAKPGQSITFALRVAAGTPTAVISAVKSSIAEVNRDVSLQFKTLTLQVDESLARERLLATLSGFFGGLALVLAMIGLYGVMSYNVTRRRNEIGIRMALGADPGRVLRMVMGEVARLIGIGLTVGLAVTLATTRLVASFLYGLTPNDPLTVSLAVALLAGAAGLAGYLQAHRASRLEPLMALREE
jgi:putative ABC transport system permease protein